MIKTTPFHPRLVALNETLLWDHWAGYAVPVRLQHSAAVEYFAVRSSVAVFDTSPLFKYRIKGPGATDLLAEVLTRDIHTCPTGRGQYTIWCDERGFVIEDGIVLRLADDEYWLAAAEPNLRHFRAAASGRDVDVSDRSEEFGILALQGPHSRSVLGLLSRDAIDLPYFGVTRTTIAEKPVMVSRTGYTGDLGYELWIETGDALPVWDALMAAGSGHNLIPMGLTALNMLRIEAGMLSIGVDFSPARFSWTESDRETPSELGLGWMLRGLDGDDRDFVGRTAIEAELSSGSTRWRTTGLEVDVAGYERAHRDRGLAAPKEGVLVEGSIHLYSADPDLDPASSYVGYATSLMYSPMLKKNVALAKLPPAMTEPGSEVYLELAVAHRPAYVPARVVLLPFFGPERKVS